MSVTIVPSVLVPGQPIESIDGQEVPRPEDGVTNRLKTLFSEMVAADKNP